MLILAIGDIVGQPGRDAVAQFLPALRQQYRLDMIIVNGENASGGIGLTPEVAREILRGGVDVITSGNHIWARKELLPHLDGDLPILRPLNYPAGAPGRGYITVKGVLVVNLIGRTFMNNLLDCPFRAMDRLLAELKPRPQVIIVDFHAEATSEKQALGRYLDGRVSAVLGTHTHVGTVDTRLLPRGTAFVTDIGMSGPLESIIGDETEAVINRFLTGIPHRLSAGKGKAIMNAVIVEVAADSGRAVKIERIYRETA